MSVAWWSGVYTGFRDGAFRMGVGDYVSSLVSGLLVCWGFCDPLDLPSFPTGRSSDLVCVCVVCVCVVCVCALCVCYVCVCVTCVCVCVTCVLGQSVCVTCVVG